MSPRQLKNTSERWKPDVLKDHLTLTEVCDRVRRDPSRVRQLEREGVIPAPVRVRAGKLRVRLYSPQEVAKIEEHFKNARPGNPKYRRDSNFKKKGDAR